MPLFNWDVTILPNNETTFLLKTSADAGYTTTIDFGYGQFLHLKVLDANETYLTIAINQDSPSLKFVGQTLEFDLEVMALYKTSTD